MDFKSSLLVVLACASLAMGAEDIKTTTVPTSSSAPPTPETTTTPPPTTSTSTSTAAPTTSPTPPTTPAPAPVTTPAPAPVTTPAPAPSDGRGNWTVVDGNVTCIIAQMIVAAKITYPLEPITDNKTATQEISVPASAKADGICGDAVQNVTMTWGQNELMISFGKNDTTKMYYVSKINLNVLADEKAFPNISDKWVNKTLKLESHSLEFKTNLEQSYRCTREESLPLSYTDSKNNDAVLVLNKVQLQAFHKQLPAVFAEAQDCELDTPDIVPIAVGCALAALVFIVLIAYLVGRRRSQARGYLSM